MYNEVQADWTVRRINVWLPFFFLPLLTAHCCLWPFKLILWIHSHTATTYLHFQLCLHKHTRLCVCMRAYERLCLHACIFEWILIIHSVCMRAAWMYIGCTLLHVLAYIYCVYPVCCLCGCTCWKYHSPYRAKSDVISRSNTSLMVYLGLF